MAANDIVSGIAAVRGQFVAQGCRVSTEIIGDGEAASLETVGDQLLDCYRAPLATSAR